MIELICEICGKSFKGKTGKERFCSKVHTTICPICGKEVHFQGSNQNQVFFKQGFRTCSSKCAKEKMLQTNLKKYNRTSPFADKNVQEKAKRTNIEKYGVPYAMQCKEISKKVSRSRKQLSPDKLAQATKRTQQTNLKKYGVKCTFQLPKSRKTMKERYGVEYTGQSKNLRDKMEQTCIDRYGTKTPMHNKEIQISMHNNYVKKYKYKSSENFEDMYDIRHDKKKLIDFINNIPYQQRTITTISHLLGISVSYCYIILKKLNCSYNQYASTLEDDINNFLNTLCINYIIHNRKLIYPNEIDIYYPDNKFAIECNGLYYHSTKLKNINYHKNKYINCSNKGVYLLHIFENDWYEHTQYLQNFIKWNLDLYKKISINNIKIKQEKIDKRPKWYSTYNYKSLDNFYNLYFNDYCIASFPVAKNYIIEPYLNPQYCIVDIFKIIYARFPDTNLHFIVNPQYFNIKQLYNEITIVKQNFIEPTIQHVQYKYREHQYYNKGYIHLVTKTPK